MKLISPKNFKIFRLLLLLFFFLLVTFVIGIFIGRSTEGTPFIKKQNEWAIGIYTGSYPWNLASPQKNDINPVLVAKDIKDRKARFIADPFMIIEGGNWFMFFEVMDNETNQGDIGLAISQDGFEWEYKQIILDEPFHLSYPYVFKWNNTYYMIPESAQVFAVRLYEAIEFPVKWKFVKNIIEGSEYVDSSILYYNDFWWLFTSEPPNDILRVFFAKSIDDTWEEHAKKPVKKGDPNGSRPGGRIILYNERIIRYAQDDYPTYGNKVRIFEVTKLTTDEYKEKELNEKIILETEIVDWNKDGYHHIDPHQIKSNKWIACIDGYKIRLLFGLNY